MQNRKLTLFSWETSTNLIESVQMFVINRFLHGNSLIFSKFSSNNRICLFLHYNGPIMPKCENTEKSETDGAFMDKEYIYITDFSVEIRVEHGLAI